MATATVGADVAGWTAGVGARGCVTGGGATLEVAVRTGAPLTGELAVRTGAGWVVGAVRTLGETVRDELEETVRVSTVWDSTVLSGGVATVDDAIAGVVAVLSDTAGFSVVQAATGKAVAKHNKLAFLNVTPVRGDAFWRTP